MNLYHIKINDNQKDALERLFNMGIVWSKTELSEAWEQLREQLKDAVQSVAIINALQDSECNCKKPSETAPKYDPCRLFRKGDRVRVAENKGRCLKPYALKIGDVLTVSKDEPNDDTCVIWCKRHDQDFYLDPAYLELFTPVEELEPYIVGESTDYFSVEKDDEELSLFWKDKHPNAKAAAEAERDRLNAEYRKEQK